MAEPSPLRASRLMNDVLYAIAMYFATLIGNELTQNDNSVFIFILLFAALGLQVAVETTVIHWVARMNSSLWAEVVVESIYMISRTLAFVIVAFSIDLTVEHYDRVIWGSFIVWPLMVIFTGIVFMSYLVKLQERHREKAQ